MKGGRRLQLWMLCSLLSAFVLGCGGDRRSGAASPGDTAQSAPADNTAVGDTTPAPQDTARPAATADTAARAPDTAAAVARRTPPKKPAAKPAAPKPMTPPAAAPAETTTAATPQPAETTTAAAPQAPAQTSDASAPLRDQYHQAPLDTVSQQVYDGWKQYNLNCARCHGEDVLGTTIAPHLIVSLKPDGPINTKELFIQTVCAGRPEKGMPSWCALGMEMDKIEAMHAYVKGRSEGKIHPGRPALRPGG